MSSLYLVLCKPSSNMDAVKFSLAKVSTRGCCLHYNLRKPSKALVSSSVNMGGWSVSLAYWALVSSTSWVQYQSLHSAPRFRNMGISSITDLKMKLVELEAAFDSAYDEEKKNI